MMKFEPTIIADRHHSFTLPFIPNTKLKIPFNISIAEWNCLQNSPSKRHKNSLIKFTTWEMENRSINKTKQNFVVVVQQPSLFSTNSNKRNEITRKIVFGSWRRWPLQADAMKTTRWPLCIVKSVCERSVLVVLIDW